MLWPLCVSYLSTSGRLVEEHSTIDWAQVQHVAVLQAVVAQRARLAREHLLLALAVLVQRKRERAKLQRLVHALEQLRCRLASARLHASCALRGLHAQRLQTTITTIKTVES